ncbi:low molecular weight protein-tyrosine-phosphatase [Nocardioides sp.]|uniref:low molecular weight protein-tyrosine-phosphatase n=1 Tax=Nocardioides sp. TaxID=35761 RepID=UPI002D80D9EA|nr:low molecular weight protein-tyrosine-phosphatase [Nocardioides sp.]HET8958884.1 low molecular weight protein-tyrosine-phosphatase [Nocardioides sp.]
MTVDPTTLPAPRTPGRYRIGVVCLGNICRSPTAHVVLATLLDQAGLDGVVEVASCGTGTWHLGEAMDDRAATTLSAAGYDPSGHRARKFDAGWLDDYDLVLAMDQQNLADIGGRTARVALFRDFDPVDTGADVPDPYYGGLGGYEEVLRMVERTGTAIVAALQKELPLT